MRILRDSVTSGAANASVGFHFSFALLVVTLLVNGGAVGAWVAGGSRILDRTSVRNLSILSATLVKESGPASSFSPEDDEDYEEEFQQLTNGGSMRRKQPKRSHRNEAMADPNFLRKRTASILSQAGGEPASAGSGGLKVQRKTFHFLFDAWAFSGEMDAADQARGLLECMEALGAENPSIQPDVRSYTKVINAISRSASITAGEEATQLLRKMESQFNTGKFAVKPNTFTYTAVMEAYANSGDPNSAQRAEELLSIMIDKFEAGDSDVQPTSRSFNAVIRAYGKIGNANAASGILDRMEALHKAGMPDAKPKSLNYNALISAWAHSGEPGSAHRAQEVLDNMEYAYKEGDEDVKPTTVSFNAVIDAYAKSGEEDATQHAEDILTRMGKLYESNENPDAKPNTRSFNSVINAWAKSGNPEAVLMAEDLLDEMKKLYGEGDNDIRPDVHSFCTVINAWARSHKPGKAERAYNIYRQMRKIYEAGNKAARPNVVAANAAMNACAYTSGDIQEMNRAVELAHKILKDLESSPYGKPDQVTYGTFLKVCANQMPDSHTRQQIVEVLFKKCAKDGMVSDFVLQQCKSMVSEELYQNLAGRPMYEHVKMEDLPREWWCNVVEGKWRRRLQKDLRNDA